MRPKTHFNFKSTVLPLCLVAVSFTLSAAEFYKWVDEDGNTVYSRNPPPGDTESSTVKTPSGPDNPEAARKAMQAEIKRADSYLEERQKQAEEAQQQQEQEALAKENCRRARTRQQSYSVPHGRIYTEDGTLIRPDEETRQKRLAEANKEVEKWCK